METDTCYCRNPHCRCYGKAGLSSCLVFHDWHNVAPRFRCTRCNCLTGARVGTAYTGLRTDAATYQSGARHLAEGTSIRATGRLLHLDKDTVCYWLPRLGRHCERVMSYFFRNLHLSECQLDELWTFLFKKEDHLARETRGDLWRCMGLDCLQSRVQIGAVVGRR